MFNKSAFDAILILARFQIHYINVLGGCTLGSIKCHFMLITMDNNCYAMSLFSTLGYYSVS